MAFEASCCCLCEVPGQQGPNPRVSLQQPPWKFSWGMKLSAALSLHSLSHQPLPGTSNMDAHYISSAQPHSRHPVHCNCLWSVSSIEEQIPHTLELLNHPQGYKIDRQRETMGPQSPAFLGTAVTQTLTVTEYSGELSGISKSNWIPNSFYGHQETCLHHQMSTDPWKKTSGF